MSFVPFSNDFERDQFDLKTFVTGNKLTITDIVWFETKIPYGYVPPAADASGIDSVPAVLAALQVPQIISNSCRCLTSCDVSLNPLCRPLMVRLESRLSGRHRMSEI